jgi:uncharacterized protein
VDGRLAAIDAARGYSLLGVAVVNAHAFNRGFNSGNYAWDLAYTSYDRAAELVSNLVFAHRSLPLLAFLLGVGLVVQSRTLDRAAVSGALFPRYLALLFIGIAHGVLLWPGEILAAYALVVLILARYAAAWPNAAIKPVLAVLLLLFVLAMAYWALDNRGPLRCVGSEFFRQNSFAQSGWLAALKWRAIEYFFTGFLGQLLLPGIWAVVLLGVAFGRSTAFWRHLREPSFRHPLVVAGGAVLVLSTTAEWFTGRAGGWSSLTCVGTAVSWFSVVEGITFFASIPILLTLMAWLAKHHAETPVVARLVAVGRAPLTMFIGQSVVFAVLFNEALLGLHGRLGRAGVLLVAVLTYLVLAAWIDRRYTRRGSVPPGERLWRALTRRFSRR